MDNSTWRQWIRDVIKKAVTRNSKEETVPGAILRLSTSTELSSPLVIIQAQIGRTHKPTIAIAPGTVLKPLLTVMAANQFKLRLRSCHEGRVSEEFPFAWMATNTRNSKPKMRNPKLGRALHHSKPRVNRSTTTSNHSPKRVSWFHFRAR